jgi:beta-glucosidase
MHRHAQIILAAVLSVSGLSSSIPRQTDNTLAIYKNASYPIEDRVEDLLRQMTVEEKAGQMFHTQLNMPANYSLVNGSSSDVLITKNLISHFNLVGNILDAGKVAEYVNEAQRRALGGRLGIPITLSSDPRHSFTDNIGTGFEAGTFSQWPESLGLAAIRDVELVRKFAETAREEYLAVGLRSALHPQVDLSTEPRWARIGGTWGEDAALTSELLVAYIEGFQGKEFGSRSVTTVTKHFPGGGPMENGEDSHFTYGKNQTYPGENFEHHLIPFKAAIAVGARQMMPYYSRPIGTEYDPVGFSFNRQIVTGLLKEELGVSSSWATEKSGCTHTFCS